MCIKADNGDFCAVCKCFKLNAEALCKNAADVLFNLRNFNRNKRLHLAADNVCARAAVNADICFCIAAHRGMINAFFGINNGIIRIG